MKPESNNVFGKFVLVLTLKALAMGMIIPSSARAEEAILLDEPVAAESEAMEVEDDCLTPVGAPDATMVAASSVRMHGGAPHSIDINLAGHVESEANSERVTSEPRRYGVQELRITFDQPPGVPGPGALVIESQADQGTCERGTESAFEAHPAAMTAQVNCRELVLSISPPLSNGRTYKITLGGEVSAIQQSFEFRCLLGDVDSSGVVDAGDRSAIIGAWTGSGFTAATDLNLSGRTDAADRSLWMGAFTSGTGSNCAPKYGPLTGPSGPSTSVRIRTLRAASSGWCAGS